MSWRTKNDPEKAGYGDHYKVKKKGSGNNGSLPARTGFAPNDRVDGVHERILVEDLADPVSGAPMEPPSAYGDTVLFSPYSGRFSAVKVPEGREVEPRYAEVNRKSQLLAKSYVDQAAAKVQNSSKEGDVKEAARMFEHAQRINPWNQYPAADLQKDPVYMEIAESNIMIQNDVQSARESNFAEKKKYLESARKRILASQASLAKLVA